MKSLHTVPYTAKATKHITESKQFTVDQQTNFAVFDKQVPAHKSQLRALQLPKKHRVDIKSIPLLGMFLHEDTMLVKVSKRTALCPLTSTSLKLKSSMQVTPLDSALNFIQASPASAVEKKPKKTSKPKQTKKAAASDVSSTPVAEAATKDQISTTN